jgi:tRNA A-37 threonylcarbamoyl transferase component Bud32/tetratricopeptide (TPR) repeat protein
MNDETPPDTSRANTAFVGLAGAHAERQLVAGDRLGRYEIVSLLGMGGMGAVYKARDTRLDRAVAIKLLAPHVRQRRFLDEARAVSALNHPNIVILYDIASDAGVDFLVLEYVPGRTLSELAGGGAVPFDELSDYGLQIADALAAAHGAGIVHRDIKPSNIIVTPESRIKVLDFGVAKLADELRGRAAADAVATVSGTEPGLVVGTISYMSPEQTRGEPLDGRSDIFSLGCVLYEAATGRLPFRGASALAIMHAIATAAPTQPSLLRPDLPPEFDAVIQRALEKDREDRYRTASELAHALRSARREPAADAVPSAERKPDAFVGRAREMHRLHEIARRAVDGAGSAVWLTGEPGLGKSALASAFLFEAVRNYPHSLIARGMCVEQYGAGEAYLPFLDALSGLLNGPHRERIMTVLRRHAPTWCLQFPGVFGSTSTIEQLQQEAIGATKERMLREFGDAVGALAATAPIVLLLEDLHWSDPASVDLLRHLGARAARHRLLLLGTFREGDAERTNHPISNCVRELKAHNLCEELQLDVLGPDDITQYLEARFRPNDFPSELAAVIYRTTEGHPLFAAALAHLLADRGDIVQSDGRWTVTRPLTDDTLEVPESVRGMIRKKLDGLEEEDRRALQHASLQGEEFLSTVLARVLDADELALEHRLDRLERAHRLIETRGEEELPDGSLAVRYRFAHALYQNILYDGILTKRRVMLHLRTAEQLAAHYAGHTARVASALAAHFERGRDYRRAIEFLGQAADVAIERYAGAAANEHYSHALALAERLPAAQRAGMQIALLQRRGTIRLGLGNLTDAKADFELVVKQAREGGDSFAECAALNALGNPFLSRYVGRFDEEMERAEHALHIAEQTADPALRAEAMVNLGLRHSVLGDPAAAKTLFEAAVPLARDAKDPAAVVRTVTYRGVGHFFQTEFREAETLLSEAVELASRARDGGMLRTALFFLGWTRASLGRVSDGLATLEQLLEMATRNSDTLFLSRVPRRIAWIHHELQDVGYIDSPGQQRGEDRSESLGKGPDLLAPVFSGVRSQAKAAQDAIAEGDLERAAQQAQLLLDNSTRHGPPKYVAVAHQLLADVATARGDLSETERELIAALEALASHPAPLVQWKIYARLGRIRRRRNDAIGARTAYAHAADIVNAIAANVTDERLRSIFLTSPAVEEVIRGTA